jgi:hypothetical protein
MRRSATARVVEMPQHRSRSAAANSAPPFAGRVAKTKLAPDRSTAKPGLVSSRAIASRPATTLAQLSRK